MSDTIFGYEAPFLRAALGQSKEYLLSKEIFWNLGVKSPKGHPPYPQLSLGNMLLSFARLLALREAGQLSDQQSAEFSTLESNLESFHNDWQTAWTGKAEMEFASRLRQWARFLDQLSNTAQGQSISFTNGLRNRAVLQLLIPHLPENETSSQSELALHDQHFKEFSKSDDFLWENEFKEHFSREEFWFLRTRPNR